MAVPLSGVPDAAALLPLLAPELIPFPRPPQPRAPMRIIVEMKSAGRIIASKLSARTWPILSPRNQGPGVGQAVPPEAVAVMGSGGRTDGSPERRGPETRTIETDGAKPALSVQGALHASCVERPRSASQDRRGAPIAKLDQHRTFLNGPMASLDQARDLAGRTLAARTRERGSVETRLRI
jgi:hypothetical protein